MGLLAGQGEYAGQVNQLLSNQWAQAAQMQNARILAMGQAAAEAQRQASQQNFESNMLPMRSFYDQQNQQFQSNLGMQSDAQRQMLGAQIGSQQSAQDFGEQQQLAAQNAQQHADNESARIAQQQQGQLGNQQAMAQFNEDQQAAQQFQQDPFATMRTNQQQSQQKGYSYSDDQQNQMNEAKKNLSAMQQSIQNGEATLPTLLPAIKQAMGTLSSVSANPSVAPPPALPDQFSKDVLWASQSDPSQPFADKPSPGYVPMQKDPKTGQWQVIRGWKAPEPGEVGEDGQIVSEKTLGLRAKNNTAGLDWAFKRMEAEASTPNGQMAQMSDPNWRQNKLQEYMGLYNSVNAGMVKPVAGPGAPGQQPDQQQVTPQNPQGAPPQQQPMAQPQQQPVAGQQQIPPIPPQEVPQVISRLKQIARDHWTPNDWFMWKRVQQTLQQPQQGLPVAQSG